MRLPLDHSHAIVCQLEREKQTSYNVLLTNLPTTHTSLLSTADTPLRSPKPITLVMKSPLLTIPVQDHGRVRSKAVVSGTYRPHVVGGEYNHAFKLTVGSIIGISIVANLSVC